jgi:hypothetical protein
MNEQTRRAALLYFLVGNKKIPFLFLLLSKALRTFKTLAKIFYSKFN